MITDGQKQTDVQKENIFCSDEKVTSDSSDCRKIFTEQSSSDKPNQSRIYRLWVGAD